jgi:hypothetical protein
MMGSCFLRAEDLADCPLQVRIKDCHPGRYEKPDLEFEDGDDKLSLSMTNRKTLVHAYGKDTDAWIGLTVELFIGKSRRSS